MDNDFQKKNEQVNDTNTNSSVEQNGNIESSTNPSNDNQQVSYNTYSSLPGIFNNQNTVSQNRNIPPENRSANKPNNRPMNRPMNRNNSSVRPNPSNPVPNQQANNRGRASEGRAFAQEFYSQPNSQNPMGNGRPPMNGQVRPNQPMGNERPPMNGQVRANQPMGNGRPEMNGQVRPNQPMGNGRPEMNGQVRPNQPMGNGRPEMNGQVRPNQPMGNEKPEMNEQVKADQTKGNKEPQMNAKGSSQQPMTEEKLKMNAQNRPHKFMAGEDSKVNYANIPEANNSNIPDNKPKRDIKYNYSALTPPDKKSTSMIILVYVIVVVLLLVGVIGYFASKGASKTESEFSEFFSNIGLGEIFSGDSNDDYSEDIYSDDVYGDVDYSDEDYSTNSDSINLEGTSGSEILIYAPVGYELREDFSSINRAVFHNDEQNLTCKAELLDGYSANEDGLLETFINPYEESYTSLEKMYDYSTKYGDAAIWQVEYSNRVETYAFIDVDSESMLSVDICEFNYDEEIDTGNSLLKMEYILDEMLALN